VTDPGAEHVQEDAEKYDGEQLLRSLNGFEQIAVEQHFRTKLKVIADDGIALMRPLLFVVEKRGGMPDADAFRKVMMMPLEDVNDRFRGPEPVEDLEQDPSLREQQDREYAEFVTAVGMAWLPEQFRTLTIGERAALLEAAAAAAKARGY